MDPSALLGGLWCLCTGLRLETAASKFLGSGRGSSWRVMRAQVTFWKDCHVDGEAEGTGVSQGLQQGGGPDRGGPPLLRVCNRGCDASSGGDSMPSGRFASLLTSFPTVRSRILELYHVVWNGTSFENPKPKPRGSKDPAKKPHIPLQIPNCIWQKAPLKTSYWGHEVRK